MQYITDSREAQQIDHISIKDIGIPSLVLMEKASLAVAGCIKANSQKDDAILVVCGTGNNGGDGVAVARLLWEDGYAVSILLTGREEKATAELKTQLQIARNLGMEISNRIPVEEYNVIVDAIFGVGLSREITGAQATVIHWMNSQHSLRIAVDIPSGISATTGKVLGEAVRADITVTFGTNKRGLVLYPGTKYAGTVIVADIGFPFKAIQKVHPRAFTLTKEEAFQWLPLRYPHSNKGTYGKVLIIAGNAEMAGACYFAAEAAYRMGAGLVKVFTAVENAVILKSKLPEALITTYQSNIDYNDISNQNDILQSLQEEINWATSVVIGPGLGLLPPAPLLLSMVLQEREKNVVIDADGLNLLAEHSEYFAEREEDHSRKICLPANFVLTPHLKEMSRLVHVSVEKLQENLINEALQALEIDNCQTLVLKDARTLVTSGIDIFINTTGNNALATGGSGDVLSGMIGGLLAQNVPVLKAAAAAVCIHGLTADEYIKQGSRYTMLASDILKMLPLVLPR